MDSHVEGSMKPIPDPTVLTTEQLLRSIQAEREFVNGQIAMVQERINGIDRATVLLSELHNRVPSESQVAISHLKSITDERFISISTQFKERDVRQERESRDNKTAVEAAFSAQKESANKQEATFAKSIDKSEAATATTISKLQDLTATQFHALADKIDDNKERIVAIEGINLGNKAGVVETRSSGTYAIAIVGGIVGMIGLLIATVPVFKG